MWQAIRGKSASAATRKPRAVRGSYDAAQTGIDPSQDDHWSWTDSLNANAANDPATRQTLRDRSRYECANNGYAGGLVRKLGNDLIGTCPRLQLTIPGVDRKVSRKIEKAFGKWARKIGLGRKLRLLDNAAVRDGEGFAIMVNNPRLPADGVQLDVRLYETDQVATPFMIQEWGDPQAFDGGRLDDHGNVVEWHFLKTHPGSDVWTANFLDADKIDARNVIHWYSPTRAGQLRGVPEILSSLTLYAYLRRYTLATVAAAEVAAAMAGVLKTNGSVPTDNATPEVTTMQDIPLVRGSLLTLPEGWDASQFKPEQPITSYGQFKTEILTEAGATLGAPQNLSTASSAAYNYSSGRLDHGIYQRGVAVRRSDVAEPALDQIFAAWLDEAAVIPGLIPDGLPLRSEWSWVWYYDGFASLDPQKEATANKTRLETGETTLAKVCAENGDDWEEVLAQRAVEDQRRAELRRSASGPNPTPDATAPATGARPTGANQPSTAKDAAKAGAVQDAALNGAQIASLLQIIDRVVSGALPANAAAAVILVSFPLMKPESVQKIVDALVVQPEGVTSAA